jgi:serine/threonine protein kinase
VNPGAIISGALPRPFGKYTLTRELGRGAMGAVFEARDSALDRRVALKLMLPSDHPDPREAAHEEQLFRREAQLCGGLAKHPNIVSVYEAGTIENRRYISMEFVDGVPLSNWTQERRPSLRTRIRVLRDVAQAVHHAHQAGILHRDLKPKNVLIDAQGRPYVTDFGMAKRASTSEGSTASSASSVAGTVVGTPSYMSPEQAQGLKKIDRRTDVYALGAMLYEILAGAPPFPGEMTIVALMRIVQDPIPAPSSISTAWAQSPEDKSIESVCMQALAKNPDDRFPDALAFADQLTKWLGDRPAAAPPKKMEEKPTRVTPRVWIPAALLPLLILLLVVVSQSRRSPTPSESRWDHATNLKVLVDPARDAVAGAWKLEGPALISGPAPHARLEIPWRPAEDYDLRATFARREGGGEVAVLLPWKGGTFVWTIRLPENGILHTAEFHVRSDGLSCNLSGRLVNSQTTYAARGPSDPQWTLKDASLLGLGSADGVVEFQEIELLEGETKGTRVRP